MPLPAIGRPDALDLGLVVVSADLLPNEALAARDLDTDAFRHRRFFDDPIVVRGYAIVPVAETTVTATDLTP